MYRKKTDGKHWLDGTSYWVSKKELKLDTRDCFISASLDKLNFQTPPRNQDEPETSLLTLHSRKNDGST